MIASLSKAFKAYTKNPFAFIWASLLYAFFFLVTILAIAGLFMIYFLAAAAISYPVYTDTPALPTIVAFVILGFILFYLLSAFNGSLLMAYRRALVGQKTSLAMFYSHAFMIAPSLFLVCLLRTIGIAFFVVPITALYVLANLGSTQYMDAVFGLLVFGSFSLVSFLFKPAYTSASAFNTGAIGALKHGWRILKLKHINFLGLYFLYGIVYLLNPIPILQLLSFLLLYPIVCSAMILMIEKIPVSKF